MTDKELKIWDECLIYLHNLMTISPEHGNAMNDIIGICKAKKLVKFNN